MSDGSHEAFEQTKEPRLCVMVAHSKHSALSVRDCGFTTGIPSSRFLNHCQSFRIYKMVSGSVLPKLAIY